MDWKSGRGKSTYHEFNTFGVHCIEVRVDRVPPKHKPICLKVKEQGNIGCLALRSPFTVVWARKNLQSIYQSSILNPSIPVVLNMVVVFALSDGFGRFLTTYHL